MFTFIIGTARSGKSSYAENRLLELGQDSPKIYVATARVYDSEMAGRVALHQQRRAGMGFTTIERTHDLGGLELPAGACVLVESLSVWAANEMFTDSGVNLQAGAKVYADFMTLRKMVKDVVLVSDDVFSDGEAYDALTEEYIKTLGGLHVRLAALADEVIECISGIPLRYSII